MVGRGSAVLGPPRPQSYDRNINIPSLIPSGVSIVYKLIAIVVYSFLCILKEQKANYVLCIDTANNYEDERFFFT